MELLPLFDDKGRSYKNCIILGRSVSYNGTKFSEYLLYVGDKIIAQFLEDDDFCKEGINYCVEDTPFDIDTPPSLSDVCCFGECGTHQQQRTLLRFLNVYCGYNLKNYEEVESLITLGEIPWLEEYEEVFTMLDVVKDDTKQDVIGFMKNIMDGDYDYD